MKRSAIPFNIKFNISPANQFSPNRCQLVLNGSNGKIKAEIAENTGTPPFTYEWSDGQTTQTANNLTAGDYSVTITDAKGCPVVSETITINQPQQLVVGQPVQLEEASCFSPNGAVVAIPVSGGLYEGESFDSNNVPYLLEILDANGNTVDIDPSNINY